IVYPLYWIASQCTGVAFILSDWCVLLFHWLSVVIKACWLQKNQLSQCSSSLIVVDKEGLAVPSKTIM
ncbi:hypothetical protein DVA76_19695, partial [Acinetobacter baumannii]